jgi:asparagine synthase (glutamine-hydrolysing)
MCGIVGSASVAPLTFSHLPERMRDTLAHRGPDDAGIWWASDRRLWLAQRRLAVVDLSPGGSQPMHDRSGRLHLVFNGEIYNHRQLRTELERLGHLFRSSSDTEVLLEAYAEWGVGCLGRLNGMFAFALYDERESRLVLARDRAGEKPLFYRHHQGRLWFASELKALLVDPALPRRVDLAALNQYLAYGYVTGADCILEGFRKLRQGEVMSYDLATDEVTCWTYWRPPGSAEEAASSTAQLEAELEALLRDSVRLRLEADVPVGILLSGGLDSSLITALAAEASPTPVRTFTITFPGHGSFDEGPHARLVADHFGTDHTALVAEPASLDVLPRMARQFDEPMADSSMIPTFLVSHLIRQHATVALGGDGGDELFGGYQHYSSLMHLQSARRLVPRPARATLASVASRLLPLGFKGRNYLIGLGAGHQRSVAHCNMYFDAGSRARLVPALGRQGQCKLAAPELAKAVLVDGHRPLAAQAMAVDFMTYLVDDILVKVDRSSMLTSLEVRSPWLDPRVLDFAFSSVPTAEKITATERKVLPRRLGRRLLPPEFDLQRKQGFSLPLDAWFRGQWGDHVRTLLLDGGDGSPFDGAEVRRLLALQERGYQNTHRLFALMIFELWRREYDVEVPS